VLQNTCATRANNYRNSVAGNLAWVTVSYSLSGLSHEGTRWEGECAMSLQNARIGVDNACLPLQPCMVPDPLGCRLPTHPEAIGECGTETSWRASSPGLSLAELLQAQRYADPATGDCSTLETRSVGSSRLDETLARASSAHAYWQTLPAPVEQEDAARHDLVKQAKLMFELGITSPNVPPDVLRELYARAPDDELSCGVSARAAVSDACRPWAVGHGLTGPLGLCQRLLSSHIAPSVFAAEIDRCQDLLARLELAGSDSCAGEYRELVETVQERLISKTLTSIAKPPGTTTVLGLGTVLARIDRWYTAAAKAFVAHPAALSDATGRVLSAFWTQVYAVGAPSPVFATGEAGSETARAQLAELTSTRIETDRQVLAAVFADPAPLDEVPVLLVVGDALSALGERLRSAAPLYDFACRVGEPCTIGEANEATRLIRILGAIGDDAQLAAALSAGAGGAVRAPWHQVLSALRARRSVLVDAFRKATGRANASLTELYLPGVVPAAAGLAESTTGNAAMWASYAGHGVLLPRDGNVIRTSLAEAKVTATLQAFLDSRNSLRMQREDYQRTRGDFARTIVDRITNQQYQTRIDSEFAVRRAEYDGLSADLDGLMASQDQAEQIIGKFLATYTERARDPSWLPDYPIEGHPELITIDATAARGSGGLASDAAVVAVRDPQDPTEPWHVEVAKGDILTVTVTGAWSPTCALRKTTLVGPTGTSVFADPTHVLTGSEGFSITWENGQFHAREHTSNDFSSQTDERSICGSISGNLLTIVDGTTPLGQLSASGSVCRQWQTGHSETDSASSGSRTEFAANFAGGLRIPRTPFPTLPGGSLLLVEVVDRPGGPKIRDAHVVRAHSTFLFPEASKLYLVVNDEGGCNAVDTSPLAITYVHGRSAAAAARSLAETMATILAALEAQKDTYLAQGSVSAFELSALHSAAYDQLRGACQCNLSAFPEEVRGMFDAWLATELASIERQTRIVAAERALDILVLQLAALQDDLAGAVSSSRLLALLTYWQLGHLAYPQLRAYADMLLQLGNDNLIPMARILYPQALEALRNSSAAQINGLRTFDWTLPYDEQVARFEVLADALKARIDVARLPGGQSFAPLVVVFPKPGGSPPPFVPGAMVAAPERLKGVWEPCSTGFCVRQRPVFTIAPDDVYGRPLEGLGCQEAAPVVQAFAVVAVNNGHSGNFDWNTNPRRADISRAAEMVFPTEDGLLVYRTDPSIALTPSRVRVLASEPQEVTTTFDTFVRSSGDRHGVSPFSSFAVELGAFATDNAFPIADATAMVAFFDVQARTATSRLVGFGDCADLGAPPESPPADPDPESIVLPAFMTPTRAVPEAR
jgi:hypothetical protein